STCERRSRRSIRRCGSSGRVGRSSSRSSSGAFNLPRYSRSASGTSAPSGGTTSSLRTSTGSLSRTANWRRACFPAFGLRAFSNRSPPTAFTIFPSSTPTSASVQPSPGGSRAAALDVIVVDKQPSKITNARYTVRRASPADAQAISALYVRAYTPANGGDARDYYPFPQIMSPDGVAAMIAGGKVVWLVGGAPGGTLVGSAAAMRNIGDAPDQIAEVFGVVVDATHRHGGLGSALVGGLVDELAGSKFILCEARTDDAGGWKVARNAGFVPVGYEPYAHSMPVGFESMVLTGRWHRTSHSHGPNGKAPRTGQAHRLREAVMGLPSLGPRALAERREALPSGADVRVRRDD